MCSKKQGADEFIVTAKLICTFGFVYAKILFSHDAAEMI